MLPLRVELPVGAIAVAIDVPSLSSGEVFEEIVVIPTSRRRVIPVGPTMSVRGDPIGLMRRELQWAVAQELFVHPRTSRLPGLTSGWLRDLEGTPTNDRSPNDVAFHTLREYVPGDDRRHVHWRTSARQGRLMVRQFIDNRRSHLALVVDANPASYADAEEFELAISMCASLGLRAMADGHEASCIAAGSGMPSHTPTALLDGLARIDLGVPLLTIPQLGLRAAPMVRSASVVAIVTGSAASLAEVQTAGRRFGANVQLVCLRAMYGQAPSVQRTPSFTLLSSNSLEGLTRALAAVGAS